MISQRSSDASSEVSLRQHLKNENLFLDGEEVVNWNENNADHPRSWGWVRKAYTTGMIFWLEFGMTFVSTAGTTASVGAREEYGYSSTVGYFAFVSL